MINISELTEKDIGREVAYQPHQNGKISSIGKLVRWNNKFIYAECDKDGIVRSCPPQKTIFI